MNGTAKFSVTATGTGLSYQWQYSTNNGSTWKDSTTAGYNTAEMPVTAAAYRNGYLYRCVVSNSLGSATSASAKLTVASKPVITTQPASVTSAAGKTVTFKVAATGASLKYQWQYSANNGGNWHDSTMTGYNTASMQVPVTAARNGYLYRCVVSNNAGSTNSSSAKLTVISKPVITTQPASVTSAAGKTVTFKVAATGASLKYQWQFSVNNGGYWKNSTMTGYNTSSMQVPVTAARNGYLYRCVVSNAAGSVNSSSAKLTVSGVKPSITVQPASITSTAGKTVTFKVVAAGSNLKYQWQFSVNNGGSWKDSTMTGYNTSSMQVPVTAARNGYLYRCIVSNSYGSTNSSSAKLTVK